MQTSNELNEQAGGVSMFRAGGIYVLPNGREVMASGDGFSFYAEAPDGKTVLRYELNEGGRLMLNGRLTAWDVENLLDTNRTGEVSVDSASRQNSQRINLDVAKEFRGGENPEASEYA